MKGGYQIITLKDMDALTAAMTAAQSASDGKAQAPAGTYAKLATEKPILQEMVITEAGVDAKYFGYLGDDARFPKTEDGALILASSDSAATYLNADDVVEYVAG